MIKAIKDFVSYWYFRYLLVTELYMVEKWERAMFHIVLFIILSILYLFNVTVVLGLVKLGTSAVFHRDLMKMDENFVSQALPNDHLKVSLYYEGLCPYCHEFILDHLYPGSEKLGDALILDLVPLGNAYHDTDHEKIAWHCQHGPLECYINKINACAIHLKSTQSQLISFLNCDIKGSLSNNTQDQEEAISKKCAEENNLAWDEINHCVNSDLSDSLLLVYENRQKSLIPKLKYVPHIRFNDIFNLTLENEARDDFLGTCCKLLKVKPSACDNSVMGESKSTHKKCYS